MDNQAMTEETARGPREACGIFAVYGSPNAAKLTYLGLFALQHRGQESAGIVSADGERIRSHKGPGLIGEVVRNNSDLARLPGHLAIGHVRYSTTGTHKPQNIQPLVMEYSQGLFAAAHNGNLVNASSLRRECEERGSIFQTSTDSEVVVHLLARPENVQLENPLARCLGMLRGAYSFVFLTKDRIIAARDPHGFRPLAIGRLDGAIVFASETCAFDLIGATYERDVEPGEIIEVSAQGVSSTRVEYPVPNPRRAQCIFEHIYFARPDSLVFGETVHDVRVRLGERLAKDSPADADIVFPVPDGGRSAALGYSRGAGIAYDRGFIRNHYVGRTFITPSEGAGISTGPLADPRSAKVAIKLNVVKSVVKGKRIVVVDDSIVRGTTSKGRFKLLRDAGAREIHVRISSPPALHPCFYGVDFPTHNELIAHHHTVEEIRQFLEVDSLAYLSVEGMLSAVSAPNDYCSACFTGDYRDPITEAVHKGAFERSASDETGQDPTTGGR